MLTFNFKSARPKYKEKKHFISLNPHSCNKKFLHQNMSKSKKAKIYFKIGKKNEFLKKGCKGRDPLKKNVFFRALPKLPNPPPP